MSHAQILAHSPATVINALTTPFLRLPLRSYCSIVPRSGRHHKLYKLKFILSPNVAVGLRPRKNMLYVTRSVPRTPKKCFERVMLWAHTHASYVNSFMFCRRIMRRWESIFGESTVSVILLFSGDYNAWLRSTWTLYSCGKVTDWLTLTVKCDGRYTGV